jgi:hypothetical protein
LRSKSLRQQTIPIEEILKLEFACSKPPFC